MTSKEALINIKDSITNNGDILEYTKYYNVIKKDLERLEKFERMFEIMKRHFYVCRGFIEGRITTPKNYNEALKHSWTKYYNGMLVTDKDYDKLYDLWLEVLKDEKI